MILYGTAYYGKVQQVNKQWIETKFFHVWFIPLIPVGSMFVTASEFRSRKGFEVSMHTKSVMAVYLRMFSLLIAAFFIAQLFGFIGDHYYYDETEKHRAVFINTIEALIASVVCVYGCFFFGKSGTVDREVREKIGSITGFYALPNWFDYYHITLLQKQFLSEYNLRFPDSDWKAQLADKQVDNERIRLLFGVSLFTCMVEDNPENEQLYYKAYDLYKV
jgi:hypothetical protein